MQVFVRDMESPIRMKSRLFIERRPAKMASMDRGHLRRSFVVLALNVMTLRSLDPNISGTNKKGPVIPGLKRFR